VCKGKPRRLGPQTTHERVGFEGMHHQSGPTPASCAIFSAGQSGAVGALFARTAARSDRSRVMAWAGPRAVAKPELLSLRDSDCPTAGRFTKPREKIS